MSELEQLKKENTGLSAHVERLREIISYSACELSESDIDNDDGMLALRDALVEAHEKTQAQSLHEIQREAIASEEHNEWKKFVINELVAYHILSKAHYDNPKKAINDLLIYVAQIAVDPSASKAAADLQRKAMEEYKHNVLNAIDEAGVIADEKCIERDWVSVAQESSAMTLRGILSAVRNMPLPIDDNKGE